MCMGASGSDTGHETAYPGLQAKHNVLRRYSPKLHKGLGFRV